MCYARTDTYNWLYIMKIDDIQIMKEQFIELLRTTRREGMENLITELEGLGFFEAPASNRSHLCKRGGLLEHSLNVYTTAVDIREMIIRRNEYMEDLIPMDSVIIICLLHDICRADIYKPVKKMVENEKGEMVETTAYEEVYDSFPVGHGEKSVIQLLRCGVDLTDDEILAIRWHMHTWDIPVQSPSMHGNFKEAKKLTPLLTLVQTADAISSNIFESDCED